MKYKVSVIKKIAFLVMTMALAVAIVGVQRCCRQARRAWRGLVRSAKAPASRRFSRQSPTWTVDRSWLHQHGGPVECLRSVQRPR